MVRRYTQHGRLIALLDNNTACLGGVYMGLSWSTVCDAGLRNQPPVPQTHSTRGQEVTKAADHRNHIAQLLHSSCTADGFARLHCCHLAPQHIRHLHQLLAALLRGLQCMFQGAHTHSVRDGKPKRQLPCRQTLSTTGWLMRWFPRLMMYVDRLHC